MDGCAQRGDGGWRPPLCQTRLFGPFDKFSVILPNFVDKVCGVLTEFSPDQFAVVVSGDDPVSPAPFVNLSLRHVALGGSLVDLIPRWEELETVLWQHVARRLESEVIDEIVNHVNGPVALEDQPKELVPCDVVVGQGFVVVGIWARLVGAVDIVARPHILVPIETIDVGAAHG